MSGPSTLHKSAKPSWLSRLSKPFKDKNIKDKNIKDTKLHKPVGEKTDDNLINAVYYPNWRVYRRQPPSSLSLDFITHIFYAFAWVRLDGSIYLSDEYADAQIEIDGVQGCLNDLRSIKRHHPHIKTILSIGGGGKGSASFPAVARASESRSVFAKTAEETVVRYDLDGIDIDWEHPANPQQGRDYIQLLAALRRALKSPGFMLTSALPAGAWALRNIDLSQASTYLDHINLMAYDFAGPWTSACGHHAQLHTPKRPHNDAAKTSCSSAVAYVLSKGVPSQKILLGIPTYGRSFLGASNIGDVFSGHAGEEGTFEYRDLLRIGVQMHFDEEAGAAYSVSDKEGFVTYDNPCSVREKALFAKQQKLGGLFYWTGTGDTNDSQSLVETGWKALRGSIEAR